MRPIVGSPQGILLRPAPAVLALGIIVGSLSAEPSDSSPGGQSADGRQSADPDVAALVRRIRSGERWVHAAESFSLRAESKWIRSEESIALERARLRRQFPDTTEFLPAVHVELRPLMTDVLELAFDRERVRFSSQQQDAAEVVHVWDGREFVGEEHYRQFGHQTYRFAKQPPQGTLDLAFSHFTWLSAGPHFFWWDQSSAEQRENWTESFAKPAEFELVGQEEFRGALCYVLEAPGAERWYVCVRDHQLCGIARGRLETHDFVLRVANSFGNSFESVEEAGRWFQQLPEEKQAELARRAERIAPPAHEYWMEDYEEIDDGCLIPMTQGYVLYGQDENGRIYESLRREIRVTDVRVGEKLSDGLFKLFLQEGVDVFDERHSPPLRYKYKVRFTNEEWDAIVAEAERRRAEEAMRTRKLDAMIGRPAPEFIKAQWFNSQPLTWEELRDRTVILDFWSIGCLPCLSEVPALKAIHTRQDESDLVVIGIHAAGEEVDRIEAFLKEHEIAYPVCVDSASSDDEGFGQLFQKYAVEAMPTAILVAPDGRVAAHGSLADIVARAAAQSN